MDIPKYHLNTPHTYKFRFLLKMTPHMRYITEKKLPNFTRPIPNSLVLPEFLSKAGNCRAKRTIGERGWRYVVTGAII